MSFLDDLARYEQHPPSEAELISEYDQLTARFAAAKRGNDPKERREARYALRHAHWYWRSIREANNYATEIARMKPGDALAGPGMVIERDLEGNASQRREV